MTTVEQIINDPEAHMPPCQDHSAAGRPRRDPAATAMNLGRLTAINRRNGNHDTAGLIAGQTFPELLSRHPGAMTASLVTDFLDEYDRTLAPAPADGDPGTRAEVVLLRIAYTEDTRRPSEWDWSSLLAGVDLSDDATVLSAYEEPAAPDADR